MNTHRTILLITNSAEAQLSYRHYLAQETRYHYTVVAVESGENALEWCQQATPDLILLDCQSLDCQLPHLNELELMDELELVDRLQQCCGTHSLPVIVLGEKADAMTAAAFIGRGVQDYIEKNRITGEGFCRAVHTILERSRLMQALAQQQEQQRVIATIALHIRQTLNLKEILQTTVEEVRHLLQADRVVVCQFQSGIESETDGTFVAESVLPDWNPLLNVQISRTEILQADLQGYQIGARAIYNIEASELTEGYIQFLRRFQVRARLVVPILLEPQEGRCSGNYCDCKPTSCCLWGLLIVHQCSAPRAWQPLEIDLLHQLTTQLEIAIRQAELYRGIQALNTNLEATVQQRTEELQQTNRKLQAEIASKQKVQRVLEQSQSCLRLVNAITADPPAFQTIPAAIQQILSVIHHFFPALRVSYSTVDQHNHLQTLLALQPADQKDCTDLRFDLRSVPEYLTALRVGQPLVAPDVEQESCLLPLVHCLQPLGIRAMLVMPLKHPDHLLGLLSLSCDQVRIWNHYEVQALLEIANFLSSTMQSILLQTQRQAAEQALQKNERKFRAIFDNTFQFMGLLTPGGTVLEINQTTLNFWRVEREAVINRPFWETGWWVVSADLQEQLRQAVAQAAQGEFVRYEVEVEIDGTVTTIDFSLRPLRDDAGQVVLLIPEGRDVSERAQLEAERKQVEQERDRLLQVLEQQNQLLEEQVTQRTADLQQSEEKFRQLAENIQSVFWMSDANCNQILYLSPAYEAIWGRSRELLYAAPQTFADAIHPQDQARVLTVLANQVAGYDEEYRILRPDGTVRWIRDRAFPIYDREGVVYRLTGIAEDITARKRAEEILNRQIATIEASIDGIAILNPQGEFTYLNAAHVKLFGYEDAIELLGKSWKILYSPAEIERFESDVFPKLLAAGAWRGEAIATRQNGSTFNEEVSLTLTSNGELICICRDISDRKRTETALRESEEKFRQLAEVVDAVFWILNLDRTERVYVSPAYEKIWGCPCTDLHITPDAWLESIHPEDRDRIAATIPKQLRREFDEEYRIVRPDGEIRWIRDRAFPIRNEQGKVYRIAGVAEDITDRKQVETEILRNRDLREAIFNESTDAIFLVDAVTRTTIDCNRRAVELFEAASKDELIYIEGNALQRHLFTETELQAIAEEIIEKGFWSMEIEYMTRRGKRFWGNLAAKQIRIAGRVMNLVRVTDISERKQAEMLLKKQQEFLRRLIDTVPNLIFTKDWEGRFTLVNQATADLYHTSIEDLIGKTDADFNPNPAEVRRFLRVDREVMTTIATKSLEETVTSSDSKQRYFQTIKTPIMSADGCSREILGVATDISDRKRMEEQLRRSEAHLLEAQRIAHVGSWEYDIASQKITWSAETFRIFGYGLDQPEPTYTELVETVYPEDRDRHTAVFQQAIEQVQPFELEYRILRPDGFISYVLAKGQPILDAAGLLISFLGTVLDITSRKKFEEQLWQSHQQLTNANVELARATRLKDEFLANMSHELRTPLNAILGISEGLQEEVYGTLTDRQRRALGTIEQSGRHLLELINDILDLAKIGSGTIDLQIAPVTLERLCNASITFVKQQAIQKNIHLSVCILQGQEAIEVDERRIRQALINLLSNAVKFTPPGGKVLLEVKAEPAEQTACFHVRDTGIGIAPEHMDKLFQTFVQIDSTLSRNYAGTGLGLALVRQIAELHGGSVSVDSTLGQGSCFTIRLPYQMQLQPGTELQTAPETAGDSTSSSISVLPQCSTSPLQPQPLILLAEDNKANIDTFLAYLGNRGYRLVIANNGLEAVKIAQTQHPELILMDIQMPKMDGLEAIRLIRAESPLDQIPIVALTALAMPGDRERCLEAGANEYLTKPISLRQLAGLLTTLLHHPTAAEA